MNQGRPLRDRIGARNAAMSKICRSLLRRASARRIWGAVVVVRPRSGLAPIEDELNVLRCSAAVQIENRTLSNRPSLGLFDGGGKIC